MNALVGLSVHVSDAVGLGTFHDSHTSRAWVWNECETIPRRTSYILMHAIQDHESSCCQSCI